MRYGLRSRCFALGINVIVSSYFYRPRLVDRFSFMRAYTLLFCDLWGHIKINSNFSFSFTSGARKASLRETFKGKEMKENNCNNFCQN